MTRLHRSRLLPTTAALALLGGFTATGIAQHGANLGGPDRTLTALSTDKPIYKTGEKVYARGVVLHAVKRTPIAGAEHAAIEIKGPKGDTVAAGQTQTAEGVWGFAWEIPAEQPGGEYTLRVTYPYSGNAPAERKFDVRVYRAPRLKTQIVFVRDGYGPGDEVAATLDAKRAEGGVPAGAKVTATARVDGAEVARVPATVDGAGLCAVRFRLPAAIERGEGSLAFAIEDGGVVETASKTIPILLQTVDLKLYPEGGDLVVGVPSRVYFAARTPAQKPADIAGAVVDGSGSVVARFHSEHEGRGRFELTPLEGARYALRIDEPAGIKKTFPLPEARAQGAALRALVDVVAPGAPVRVRVVSPSSRKVRVTLAQREVELASAAVELAAGRPAEVALAPREGGEGVLAATVWDERGAPLAERLVLRAPAKKLDLELRADKPRYAPGDTVTLTARASIDGKPVEAWIGLTVADDSVLELVEKREQAPDLPAMVFLEPEVEELADVHVYLDAKSAKAPLATDLLLGTQGWRRFAQRDPVAFAGAHGDAARRVLALRLPTAIDQLEDDRGVAIGGLDHFAVQRAGALPPEAAPVLAAAPARVPKNHAPARPPPADPKAPLAPRSEVSAVADKPMPVVAQPAAEVGKMEKALAENKKQRADKDVFAGERRARLGKEVALEWVREYAHVLRANRRPADRVDFTETLYWNAAAHTDPKSGEARVRFALSDAVTSFKAIAGGFTAAGALGSARTSLESVQPFYAEAKIPLEVTSGDRLLLPVALVNGTEQTLIGGTASIRGGGDLRIGEFGRLDLKPGERVRRLVEVKVGAVKEPVELVVAATAGPYSDSVTRPLRVKPSGFPFEIAFGGLTKKDAGVSHALEVPATVVPASVKTTIAVYPTPLANMTEALARLIQDPYGCFEQTSSTTYPLTMAQQYFTSHQGVDPKLIEAAKEKLEKGYQRLKGFECSDKGYEWFGENPGHEALTAYGVLHFNDMAKVRPVDRAMLERSRAWLMKQRDGKGGFERKRRALHTWIEDKDCSDGYITWALLEAGESPAGLSKEVGSFKVAAQKSPNSYVAALGANVARLADDRPVAASLMGKLASRQGKDGHVAGATQSIVGSGGEALDIETTALASLAWLRDPAYAGNVERAIRYLADSCKGGRYGSTQSTVLALRAIVAYDQARARPKAPGSVRVYVDGQPVGSAVAFDANTRGAIKLPDVSELLAGGKHTIELRMQGGGEMPYAIAVTHNALKPESSKEAKVDLAVHLAKDAVVEGELVEAYATVTNRTRELIPTTVAIVGLPGGLEPRHDQLKELKKRGVIDAYEVIGRDVVLYWRGMKPEQVVRVPLSLTAAIPGTYAGPASRAYLYYTDEHKNWVDPLKVSVAAK
jgi:hypothetical protein